MPKRKPGLQTGDDINTRFGASLRAVRVHAGRSQSEVGEALGVSFQQIQKYENGTTSISLSRMEAISTFLQVSMTKLLASVQDEGPDANAGYAEHGQAAYGDPPARLLGAGPLTKQKIALLGAFDRITEAQVRRNMVALAEAIASSTDDESGDVADQGPD